MPGGPDTCPLPTTAYAGSPRIANLLTFQLPGEVALVSASGAHVPVFSAPAAHEIEALALSAAYLKRAGNEAASRLLAAPGITNGKIELIATLRDEMRDSAALCERLIAMFDDWGIPDQSLPSS